MYEHSTKDQGQYNVTYKYKIQMNTDAHSAKDPAQFNLCVTIHYYFCLLSTGAIMFESTGEYLRDKSTLASWRPRP